MISSQRVDLRYRTRGLQVEWPTTQSIKSRPGYFKYQNFSTNTDKNEETQKCLNVEVTQVMPKVAGSGQEQKGTDMSFTVNLLEKYINDLQEGSQSIAYVNTKLAVESIFSSIPKENLLILLPQNEMTLIATIAVEYATKHHIPFAKLDFHDLKNLSKHIETFLSNNRTSYSNESKPSETKDAQTVPSSKETTTSVCSNTTTPVEPVAIKTPSKTLVVVLELLSYPYCKTVDLAKIAEAVSSATKPSKSSSSNATDPVIFVDNTWATPYLSQPLKHGADIVLHSTILDGKECEGTAIKRQCKGAIVTFNPKKTSSGAVSEILKSDVTGKIDRCLKDMNISPYDAWLNLKEDRAGSNRCQTISDSAMVIAEYLSDHEAIEKVYYPGLISNSSHNAATKVMKEGRYFGGKIGLSIKSTKKQTSEEVTQEVISYLQLFKPGVTSFYDVQSRVEYCANVTLDTMYSKPLPKNLLFLSIGLEDTTDLIADLDTALNNAANL